MKTTAPKSPPLLRDHLLAVAVGCLALAAHAETLYVDAQRGRDTNPGSAERPLQTLSRVAELVNAKSTREATTVKLRPGVYMLSTPVVFENQRAYSEEQRLTLEALVLPDDPEWQPGIMPTILSVEDPRPSTPPGQPTQTYGLKIKMSHVTVRGLKFLGSPLFNNWYCPLECLQTNLTDILVTQCMFVGNPDTLDIYCGVITDGHEFVVDHCIFSDCHACAVFWDGDRGVVGRRNAMRYCIVEGAKISGVWTCETDEDFAFHHNIVTGSEYFWMLKRGAPKTYRVRDCVVSGNKHYSGYGVPSGASGPTGPEIRFVEEQVEKDKAVMLQRSRTSKHYLHVMPGTPGSQLGAGLFKQLRAFASGSSREPAPADVDSAHFLAPAQPPRTHYRIDCSLDLPKLKMLGHATITLSNTSGVPLNRLAIDWSLAAAGGRLTNLRVNGQPVQVLADLRRSGKEVQPMVFQLPQTLQPDHQLTVDLDFDLQGPDNDIGDGVAKIGPWYPALWWGYSTHDDYSVSLKVPPDYLLLTSGIPDPTTGRHELKNARSFGIALGNRKRFEMLQANAGDVLIRCVVSRESKACGQLLLETAVDVVNFYRDLQGFYPQPSLTIVPGSDEPMGGFPVATALVAVHGMERMSEKPPWHWQWVTAHEIGHQYWSEHVLEKDEPGGLWLGMGLLMDRAYSRARGLPASIHKDCHQQYVNALRDGHDTTLAIAPEKLQGRNYNVFNNAVLHGKSYALCSALGVLLGQSTFDRITRHCLQDFAGRRLGWAQFQRLCEEESGQDLDWFFTAWVLASRSPNYEMVSTQTIPEQRGFLTTVKVACRGPMPLPIPVRLVFSDGTHQTQTTDRLLSETTLEFRSQTRPAEILLDPDNLLPPPQPKRPASQ